MSKTKLIHIIILLLFPLNFISCRSSLIFYPDKKISSTPEDLGLLFESVNLKTKDNVMLNGWWVPSNKQKGVILFFHGNAGNISNRLESIRIFNQLDLSVFIIDYRGYGRSSGDPTEEGTYIDAESSWNYLVITKDISPENIIIFGRSLGGSIAVWLAQHKNPKQLIVESSFTSFSDVAAFHSFDFLAKLLFNQIYNTKEYIKNVHCPVLIIHSPDDETVPFNHGKILYNLANEPKYFLTIYGSHNYGFIDSVNQYKKGIKRFLFNKQ